MDLVKKGLEFSQTIKNVSRFREIITVFARNGLDEFVIKSGLHKIVPNFVLPKTRISTALEENSSKSWGGIVGYRLKKSFEELGPSFVKIGQLLSSREDIFPEEFIDQLKPLRDQVKGIDFSEVEQALNESLGKNYKDIFESVDKNPIGNASIGVVYKAKLKSGEDVVLKVRRPNIKSIIETDMSIVQFIVSRLEKVSEEVKYLGVSRIVRDFSTSLKKELDFKVEALNCDRLKENIESRKEGKELFHLPKIYHQYTSEDLLVMEFLDGVPFSDSEKVKEHMDVIQAKLEKGVHLFIKSLLSDGFFHADLHGGNFFLLKDEKIGLIDFGLVGHLSKKSRTSLIVILYSLITHNYENLVFEFLDVAEYDDVPDVDELTRDIRDTLSPYVGLTVQQMNLTELFNKSVSTLLKHKIFLPREWFIVFRAMISLDGVGKSLNMDLDIFSIIDDNLGDVLKDVYSKESLLEDSLLTGRDLINSLRIVPRHIRWFVKDFAKNNYSLKIVHSGHEAPINDLKNAIVFFGHTFLAGLFLLSGVFLIDNTAVGMWYGMSKLTFVFWTFALVTLLRSRVG